MTATMKSTRTALIALVALLIAGIAFAGGYYPTPTAACEHDAQVQKEIRDLEKQGFVEQGMYETPLNYFVQPETPYVWGTVMINMACPNDDGTTDYADVNVEVTATDHGYTVTQIGTTRY